MSRLEQFRVDSPTQTASVAPAGPERLLPGAPGWVLSFDQTLSSSGWCVLHGYPGSDNPWSVAETGMIKTEVRGKGGYEDSYRRGMEIHYAALDLIATVMRRYPGMRGIAHEMPTVGPKRSVKSEGSHIAIMAIRTAAVAHGIKHVAMLNAQHVKKVVTGNRKAEKPEVREHVLRHISPDTGKDWAYRNADVFDAVAIGLTYMHEQEVN